MESIIIKIKNSVNQDVIPKLLVLYPYDFDVFYIEELGYYLVFNKIIDSQISKRLKLIIENVNNVLLLANYAKLEKDQIAKTNETVQMSINYLESALDLTLNRLVLILYHCKLYYAGVSFNSQNDLKFISQKYQSILNLITSNQLTKF
jgi:hypothetical protein